MRREIQARSFLTPREPTGLGAKSHAEAEPRDEEEALGGAQQLAAIMISLLPRSPHSRVHPLVKENRRGVARAPRSILT
jgi:hypothetical protein